MKYKIAIVEDQENTSKIIKNYLLRYGKEQQRHFDIVEYADGSELVIDYEGDFDIIFLDIEMKHLNGMETALRIREIDQNVIVIFITNNAQYAIKGYAVDALSFLLKPVPYFAFSQELKRSLEKLDAKKESFLLVTTEEGLMKIDTRQIFYIESMKHTLYIHTKEKTYAMRGVMKDMEQKLAKYHFARCNNCYLVNLSKVKGIKGDFVILKENELKMSRGRKKIFMEALASYVGEVM